MTTALVMECHQCQNVIFYFRLTSPIFVNKFCLIVVFFCLFRYRHFIRIQTFYSDTDISFGYDILFGYRHFIRMQTFYSDTDILFKYRHFIRIQTFYSDTDILFGYRHFIRIQAFHSDTDIFFGYRHFLRIQTFYFDTDFSFELVLPLSANVISFPPFKFPYFLQNLFNYSKAAIYKSFQTLGGITSL